MLRRSMGSVLGGQRTRQFGSALARKVTDFDAVLRHQFAKRHDHRLAFGPSQGFDPFVELPLSRQQFFVSGHP